MGMNHLNRCGERRKNICKICVNVAALRPALKLGHMYSPTNVLLVELHHWILHDVAQVQHFSFAHDFGMFVHHEPADVGEEEATVCIVRI